MGDEELRQILEKLLENPDDSADWSEIPNLLEVDNRAFFLSWLEENPQLLKRFITLMDSDPVIASEFKLTLQEMDALEPFIESLKNMPESTGNMSAVPDEQTEIEHLPSSVENRHEKSEKPSEDLERLDADLADILDTEEVVPDNKASFEKALEDLDEEGNLAKQKRDSDYQAIIHEASSKLYSYNDQDIDDVIALYAKAFSLKEGTAMDWYNLGQTFLKRAQRKVGVFSYSFEGHYKDLSDYYEGLNASKKAVNLAPGDKTYWEILSTIYEMMGKKPMALFCARKSLELQLDQERWIAGSTLLDSTETQSAASEIIQKKVDALQAETEIEIDPFDDNAVAAWESQARKEKEQKGMPLDHVELYAEALESMESGDVEAAKNRLTKATKLKPDFFEPWIVLANIHTGSAMTDADKELQQIEFSDASRCLERAIQIRPNSIEPYKLFAKQYEFLDSRDNFIRVLDKIIELEPENWEYRKKLCDVNFEKGLHFHIYGDTVQADYFLHKAIDQYPYDPRPWTWLGKNFILKGQYADAISALQESFRLDPSNVGVKEGLIEAFSLRAKQYQEAKLYDDAFHDINEIFSLDPENDDAMTIQTSIVDDYCEMGFDALEAGNIEDARRQFENALSIKQDHPFCLAGIARCEIAGNDEKKALDAFNRALEEWNVAIVNYDDEFVIQAVLEIFKEIISRELPYDPSIEQAAEQFKRYLDGFMNLVPLLHGDHVHMGQVYVAVFQFFLEISAIAATSGNENAGKILESFQATELPIHQGIVGDWKAMRNTSDETITQQRLLVLKDLKFFLDHLFNMFLFKSHTSNVNDILTFINYLRQDLSLTIKEIYDILEFAENGQSLIRIFDLLATYTHVASAKVRTSDLVIMKTSHAILMIRPHPTKDVQAMITSEPKLIFADWNLQPLESTIYSGKTMKIKPSDVQWSQDGNKLLITESKEEKRSFKALMQHGNQIIMLDMRYDPMINPEINIMDLDPSVLEQQVMTVELDQKVIVIGWKDQDTFQALLKDGTLMRWKIAGGVLEQKMTRLPLDENDLIVLSPNQELIAILSSQKKTLTYVNIRTDQKFNFTYERDVKVIALKWDNASSMAHFLTHALDTGKYSIALALKDGSIQFVVDFDEKDLNEDVFEPLIAGQQIFYLLRAGNKLIITEASNSMWMEFPLEVDAQSVLAHTLLNLQWINTKEIRFYMEDAIVKLDLTPKMKQMLSDRIGFLERFPRSTFVDKADWLKTMQSALE